MWDRVNILPKTNSDRIISNILHIYAFINRENVYCNIMPNV